MYLLDYDPIVLAVGIAFFACHGLSRGFRDYEISLPAAAWMVPLLSRGIAGVTGIPLGVVVMLAVYVFACCVPCRMVQPSARAASRRRDLICSTV